MRISRRCPSCHEYSEWEVEGSTWTCLACGYVMSVPVQPPDWEVAMRADYTEHYLCVPCGLRGLVTPDMAAGKVPVTCPRCRATREAQHGKAGRRHEYR